MMTVVIVVAVTVVVVAAAVFSVVGVCGGADGPSLKLLPPR